MLRPHTQFKLQILSLAVAASLSPSLVAEEVDDAGLQDQPSYMMNQVVVTATKTENNLATAPASMSVISSEEIQSRPHTALNDIVAEAVGVESMKTGGRAGRELISIRGMDSKYTMILVNGRKVSSSNAIIRGNDFDYASIPQDNIEQIEIIRGPMSALYGSEAMGGVINIITKVPDNEWRSSISGDYSRPTSGGDGGAEFMIGLNSGGALIDDELYMNFSINKSARDAWKPFDGDRSGVTALEERDTLSLSGGLNWLINDRQTLDFDVSYSNDEREGLIESTINHNPTDQKVKRNSIAITHGGEWDWGDSQLRYSREEVEIGEYDFGKFNRDYVTETNNAVDGSVTTEINSHRLTLGGEVRKIELDNKRDLLSTGNARIQEQALFIQDEWSLNDDWMLTYGTRVDNHEEFGTEFSPRAYLVNTVNDKLTVKGGVGKAFNAPTLLQLSEEYRLSSRKGTAWIIGNPDLKPETSTSYELAMNYQEENWMVEAAIFRNDVDDLIMRDFDNLLGIIDGREAFTYKNVDKARIDGLELGGRINLSSTLSLKADYTYIDAMDRTNNQKLTNRPQQTLSSTLDWKATNKLNTFVKASYQGKQVISHSDNVDVDGYTLVDLGVNYRHSDDLRFRAGISNLTNKSLKHEAETRGVTVDPRTWYVGFTTDF
ncbi:TonB-dependent receptor domain-containing protein [Endozoicomonas lisbonensis]|uniref:Outer membrane receptor for ferrienterochelin and colicins n=1 Tax=Endozoicomonas lisbonensis TaxID=3120522 RepID=A0ABV2SI15_9GAMM